MFGLLPRNACGVTPAVVSSVLGLLRQRLWCLVLLLASALFCSAVLAQTAPVTLNAITPYYNGTTVIVSWTQSGVGNFASYNVYRATSPKVTPQTGTLVATLTSQGSTSYYDSGATPTLQPGTTYYYIVCVVDSAGQVSPSNEQSILQVDNPPAAVRLNQPSPYYSLNSVQLSWSQNNEYDFASYKIYRGTSPGVTPQNGTLVNTLTGNSSTSTVDSGAKAGVAPGTTYYYIVCAVDRAGQVTPSNEQSIVQLDKPPVAVTLNQPSPYYYPNSVQLSWNQSSENDFASYKIYRGTVPGVTSQNGILVASSTQQGSTSATDSNAKATIAPGTTYYYVVYVVDAAGQATVSNEQSLVQLDKPPAAVTLNAPSAYYYGNSVQLSWSQNSDSDFASYKVYRGTTPGVTSQNGTLVGTNTSSSSTSLTDSSAKASVAPGTTYYYVVAVTDAAGQITLSNEQSILQLDSPPAAVKLNAPSPYYYLNSVQLSWNQSYEQDFASYKIYRGTAPGVTAQNGTLVGTNTSSSSTSITDSNAKASVAPGTSYYYVVYVVDAAGQGTPSNEQSILQLDKPPVAVTLNAPSLYYGNTSRLSWSQNSDYDFASYKVYQGTAPGVTAENGTLIATNTSSSSTSATDPNAKGSIAPGTTYYYVVAVTDAAGQVTLSNEQSLNRVIYPPAVPTNFVATAGNTQVVLSWSAATGATSYKLFRSTTSGSYTATPLATLGTVTSYTDNYLPNNTRYYYILIANNADGDSANSTEASATPSLPLPSAPTNFVAIPGNAQVALSWSASSGATSYKLFRSTQSGIYDFTSPLATVTTTSYTDTGVTNGTTYFYVVSAANADGGTGASSAEVVAVPATQIGSPANLRAVASDGAVTLTWDRAARATAYQIKRETASSGAWSIIGQTDALSFTDSSVTNGTSYSYVVVPLGNPRTVNQEEHNPNNTATNTVYDEGPSSDVVDATPNALTGVAPATPTALTASAGAGRVDLRWNASSGATSYEVARATSSSGPFTALAPTTQSSVYSDPNLTNGTTYYYQVTAIGASGARSAPTAPVAATPNATLAVASNLTATGGNGQVALSWNSVAGASAYWIYRSLGASAPPTLIEQAVGTSYVDAQVTNGLTYYYSLRTAQAVTGSAPLLSAGTAPVAATPNAPSASPLLTVIAGDNQVLLSWDAPDHIIDQTTSYEVWWQTGVGAWSRKTTVSAQSVGFPASTTVTGLVNGTIYGFFVRPLNSSGVGVDSNVVNAVPLAKTPEKPGKVGFVGASSSWPYAVPTKTTVTLIVPPLPFGADALNIYMAPYQTTSNTTEDNVLVPVKVGVTSTDPITVSGLTPGQTYQFRAVAVNANGTTPGDVSSVQTATDSVLAGPPAAPAAPSFGSIGYSVASGSSTSAPYITVMGALPSGATDLAAQWKLSTDPDSVFEASGHMVSLNYQGQSMPAKVTPLLPATTYVFRLKATNSAGSTLGPTATATTLAGLPDAPPAPTITATTANSVTLSVPPLPARATSLDLLFGPNYSNYDDRIDGYRDTHAYFLSKVAPGSITVTGLPANTTMQFWWVARGVPGVVGKTSGPPTSATLGAPTLDLKPVFRNLTETSVEVVTGRVLYWNSNLSLQMKLSGAPTSTYQNVATNLQLNPSQYTDNPVQDTVTSISDLTPGQSYDFRYVAPAFNNGADIVGPTVTIVMPTATTTWSPGAPIACPGIRYPQPGLTIRGGTIGKLNAGAAVDWDLMTRTINGWSTSRAETDTCIYTWSASAGSFPDGNMGDTVRWQAPLNSSSTVTFTLTVSDQGNRNKGVAEVGNRGDTTHGAIDAPLHFTTTIQVVP